MPRQDDPLASDAFQVVFSGRSVNLLLHPVTEDRPLPRADAVVAALRRSPLSLVDAGDVARILARHAHTRGERLHEALVEVAVPSVTVREGAGCAIAVSLDRLAAYVVPLDPPPPPAVEDIDGASDNGAASNGESVPPPAPEPVLVSAAALRELLRAEGVVAGLLDEVIDAFGAGKTVDEIDCVARGSLPVPAVDAVLEYHVDSGAPGAPLHGARDSVDLHALAAHRYVETGVTLLVRRPPVAGVAGVDVLGVTIAAPVPRDYDLARYAGLNTEVQEDRVVSTAVGRPVINPRGGVDVLPVFEVAGNVDYAVGNIEFPGDVVVGGDVKPGFAIVAGGSVTVRGLVEGASITAGHDVTVLGTVGEHPTTFEVGGNLVARYLHTTEARVAGAVTVAGEILNCHIAADRVHMSPQGRIVGGVIEAAAEVDAGVLGGREGTVTELRVTSDGPAAVIRARRLVQPGVVLLIGASYAHIEDPIEGASFWNVRGAVTTLRSTTELAAVQALREESAA